MYEVSIPAMTVRINDAEDITSAIYLAWVRIHGNLLTRATVRQVAEGETP